MFPCLVGCGIKSLRPIFKAEMSIYLSKANLDVKIFFGKKITHHVDPGFRKMLVSEMFGNGNSKFHSGP